MKRVLISGGSGGIGSAIARQAAAKGWSVVIGFHAGRESADQTLKAIRKTGGQADLVHLPLHDPKAIAKAVEGITPPLNALILAAAPAPAVTPFLKINPDEFQKQWEIQVVGAHSLVTAIWKRFFAAQNGGHVIAILSEAMDPPVAGHMTSYITAKRGLAALLECALVELGPAGLRASAVSPSYTETPMLKAFHPHVLEAARAKQRFLSPDDVATAVVQQMEKPPADATLHVQSLKG